MDKLKECCESCRFFSVDNVHDEDKGKGWCRRHPPQLACFNENSGVIGYDIDDWAWPMTLASNWCGEFDRKSSAMSSDQFSDDRASYMRFGVRARKTFYRLGISSWSALSRLTEYDLLEIKGCGQSTIDQIKEVLSGRGLSLRRNPLYPLNPKS